MSRIHLTDTYSTFSGADIVCSVTIPVLTNDSSNNKSTTVLSPITIGNLQTITVSSHRDSVPVKAFKYINPKGFTRGTRTIAGSMIFTLFDTEALRSVQDKVRIFYQSAHTNYAHANTNVSGTIPRLMIDELPPFDVTITMANEYGSAAHAKILGIQIITNGQVIGIDDMFMEEQVSYLALDYIPLSPGFDTHGIR